MPDAHTSGAAVEMRHDADETDDGHDREMEALRELMKSNNVDAAQKKLAEIYEAAIADGHIDEDEQRQIDEARAELKLIVQRKKELENRIWFKENSRPSKPRFAWKFHDWDAGRSKDALLEGWSIIRKEQRDSEQNASAQTNSGDCVGFTDEIFHALLKQPAQRLDTEINKIAFLLARSKSLQHLSQRDLHRLAKVATVHHHKRGDFVFRAGENADRVYLIESGRCKSFAYDQEQLTRLKPESTYDDAAIIKPSVLHGDEAAEANFETQSSGRDLTALGTKPQGQFPSPGTPLLSSVRAKNMLQLSSLRVHGTSVKMHMRGASTLDKANWQSVRLSADERGLMFAENLTCLGDGDPTIMGHVSSIKHADQVAAVGTVRDIRRVEEVKLRIFPFVLRIEFLNGDLACFAFDQHAELEIWAKHLRRFQDDMDAVLHALVKTLNNSLVLFEGDLFGADEMLRPNPIQAQCDPRSSTVMCLTDVRLLVLGRMDFLTIVEKKPVFSLPERLETLSLSGIIPLRNRDALFRAGRAMVPVTVPAHQMICRAGMPVGFVYIVLRGFVSVCDDNLEPLTHDGDSVTVGSRVYISRVRRIHKLGAGEAFGHLDAASQDCVYSTTLIADTTSIVFRLPVKIFLECSEGHDAADNQEQARTSGDNLALQVTMKAGFAAQQLQHAYHDQRNATPSLHELLGLHSGDSFKPAPGSKRLQMHGFTQQADANSEEVDVPSNRRADIVTVDPTIRTESINHGQGREESASPIGMNADKIDLFRRQFRQPPAFRPPKSPPKHTNKNKSGEIAINLPVLDLTKFLKKAHSDDAEEDEAEFNAFGVDESCRGIVRSLREIAEFRNPQKRTLSQRVKKLVRNDGGEPSTGSGGRIESKLDGLLHSPAFLEKGGMLSADLLLRVDRLANRPQQVVEDTLRYMLRDLAVSPGGILVYPGSRTAEAFRTGFVKFDNPTDLQSAISRVQRMGMLAQESTIDELATFHMMQEEHSDNVSMARPLSKPPRPPMSARGVLQGSRVRSAFTSAQSTRNSSTRPSSSARVPALTARGHSTSLAARPNTASSGAARPLRPQTAPTASESPFQLINEWQQQIIRPGTTAIPRVRVRYRTGEEKP